MHPRWFIVDKIGWKLRFVSVWFKVIPAICATMDAPPNVDESTLQPMYMVEQLADRERYPPYRLHIIPTQIRGHFALREVLVENRGDLSRSDEFGLENVLVHFDDMNGEWLHSELLKESHPMKDVEAILYFIMRRRIERDMCYRLVWHPKRRGPYPSGCGDHSESFLEVSDLNSAEGVHRTDDRQVMITCVKTKLNPAEPDPET